MSHDPSFASGQAPFVLLSCEHGGREVPPEYEQHFLNAESALASHRGYDLGALPVAQMIAARLSLPIIFSTVTRLLVDLNRSVGQPDLFSEFSRELPEQDREEILATYYEPHRRGVVRVVESAIHAGYTVIHIGFHSCADRLAGQERDLDIALLFDDSREREASFCNKWRKQVCRGNDRLRFLFNEPYLGRDDGLTTTLRNQYDPRQYLGIEVELRQGIVRDATGQRAAADLLAQSLAIVLDA